MVEITFAMVGPVEVRPAQIAPLDRPAGQIELRQIGFLKIAVDQRPGISARARKVAACEHLGTYRMIGSATVQNRP